MFLLLIILSFFPCFYFLNINLTQSNDDSQLYASIETISNSIDDFNFLYIQDIINVTSVHHIIKNLLCKYKLKKKILKVLFRGKNAILLMDKIGSFIINDKIYFRIENIIFQQNKNKWRADFLSINYKYLKSFEIYV